MFRVTKVSWNPALKRTETEVVYETDSMREAAFVEKEVVKTMRRDRRGWFTEGGMAYAIVEEV